MPISRHAQRLAVLFDRGVLQLQPLGCSLSAADAEQLIIFIHHRQRPLIPFQRANIHRFTYGSVQIGSLQQMLDGSGVSTAGLKCGLDCLSKPVAANLFGQLQQIDHLPGPALLAMPRDQSLPDLVETVGP